MALQRMRYEQHDAFEWRSSLTWCSGRTAALARADQIHGRPERLNRAKALNKPMTSLHVPANAPYFRNGLQQDYFQDMCSHQRDETMDFAAKVFLPEILYDPERVRDWINSYRYYPLVYHSMNYSVFLARDCLANRAAPARSKQALMHHGAILRLLREHLADLDRHDPCLILMAMQGIAFDVPDHFQHVPNGFQPYLPRSRFVCVFGRLESDTVHRKAIVRLIEQNGGLKSIPCNSLAALCSDCALMACAKTGGKPALPPYGTANESIFRSHHVLASTTGSSPGRGFFARLPADGLFPRDVRILVRLSTFDRYMALVTMPKRSPGVWAEVGETANAVLHAILSMTPWQDLDPQERKGYRGDIYECCRQAAALYAPAVIRGIPPDTGWQWCRASNLRTFIESHRHSLKDVRELLLWVLFVAGLGSLGSADRSWFEDSIRELLDDMSLHSWPAIEAVLMEFLWTPAACGKGAAVLWASIGPRVKEEPSEPI